MALSNETSAQLEAKVKASLRAGTPLPKSVAFDAIRITLSEKSTAIDFFWEEKLVSTHIIKGVAIGDQINLDGLAGVIPLTIDVATTP